MDEPYATEDSGHSHDETQNSAQRLRRNIRMDHVLFQFEAVRVLTLGHHNDAFSGTWKGLVIAFQCFWWRQGSRERS